MEFPESTMVTVLSSVNRSLSPSDQINMNELNKLITVNKDEYDTYVRMEFKKGRTNSPELIAKKTLKLLRRSASSSKSGSRSRSRSRSASKSGGRKSKKSRKTKRRR